MRKIIGVVVVILFLGGLFLIVDAPKVLESLFTPSPIPTPTPTITPSPTPTTTPTVTPTPTPRPLTLAEMNELYGPCVAAPVLMYHHVEDGQLAASNNHTSLNVAPDKFRQQMQYLKDRGYQTVTMAALNNFFDNGVALPSKPALITFDDGYVNFYQNAWPILQEFGFTSTVFLTTGLMENDPYLSWGQIDQAKGNVLFANHTWSHKSLGGSIEAAQQEISLADTQLTDRGLNSPKTFAYPYGTVSKAATDVLGQLGYRLAFTIKPGRILCAQQRLTLPRVRVGNADLGAYGL